MLSWEIELRKEHFQGEVEGIFLLFPSAASSCFGDAASFYGHNILLS